MSLSLFSGIGIMLILAWIQIPPLLKKKQMKELVVYSMLFLCAATVSILYSAGIEVQTPLTWIEMFYKPILDFFLSKMFL